MTTKAAIIAATMITISLLCSCAQPHAVEYSLSEVDLADASVRDRMAPEEPPAVEERMLAPYDAGPADLQYPSYPTGCEGVAAAVMLRMNGAGVTNDMFMAALPRSGDGDFVNAYWGDPATEYGFACMAPAITRACMPFCPSGKSVVDITGTPLVQLPAPCVVWVTIGFNEPVATDFEKDGYRLFRNTHCVVLLSCDDVLARVWDPMKGYVDVPFTTMENVYTELGRQAVYIAPRGY